MSSLPVPLTEQQKANIQRNRELALERLKKNKELKKLQSQNVNNNENRLKFPGSPVVTQPPAASKPSLTPEQKAEIERKRLEALERAKVNKLIPPDLASDLAAHRTSPGKPQKVNLYLKVQNTIGKAPAPSKFSSESRAKPYEKEKPGTVAKPAKPVICSFEIISDYRFIARTDNYSETVINEFKKINSKAYNYQTRNWSFDLKDYDQLIKNLAEVKLVTFERIPEFVLKIMKKESIQIEGDAIFEDIEPELSESLMDFQREGVRFGISRGGRFMLADDMGLGKTRQALAVADYFKSDWPLLIVTSASLKTFWQTQIIELLPQIPLFNIRLLETHNDSIFDAQVVICSYSAMENNMNKLRQKDFGVMIFDESHNIKNSKSKQTINATKLAEKTRRVILITGTPALSRPAELFPQLAIIDGRFASYHQFTIRYCQGHNGSFGWVATGSGNLDELNLILRKNFMIRRTKDDVYSELGDKKREVVELKVVKGESKEMKKFAENYQKFEGKKRDQKEVLINWFSETAKLKAGAVCAYIENFMKNQVGKCLIFASHFVIMDSISTCLVNNKISFMRIDGSTKSDIRAKNVDAFQNDPNMRCAILSIRACSAGLTLTAANTVIFAELDWTPSTILQAEGRAHRIGQDQQVKVIFLIALGTADEIIWKMLKEKQKNLTKVGLVGDNEHFSQNITKSEYDPGPSTSKPAQNTITNYYVTSPTVEKEVADKPTSPEIFYSCETFDDDDFDMEALIDAEQQATAKPAEKIDVQNYLEGINFDDDENFDV